MTSLAADPTLPAIQPSRAPQLSPVAVVSVICLAFGVFAVRSALGLLQFGGGELSGYRISLSNSQLGFVVAYEAVIGTVLVLFLRRRGWRLEHLTRPFTAGDLPRGVALWLLAMVLAPGAVALALKSATSMDVQALFTTSVVGDLHIGLMVAAVIIRPLYEELIYLGFIPAAFPSAAGWLIVLLSTVLRVLIHSYQGVLTFLVILPMGLVLAGYYMRSRRVWPVVLAHALQDVIGFSVLSSQTG
jgi:uncharacterized protein